MINVSDCHTPTTGLWIAYPSRNVRLSRSAQQPWSQLQIQTHNLFLQYRLIEFEFGQDGNGSWIAGSNVEPKTAGPTRLHVHVA